MLDRLTPYYPDPDYPYENYQVQQLLDMARGRPDSRSLKQIHEAYSDLFYYNFYNGGEHGIYHVVHGDRTSMAAALSHTAWFANSLQLNAIAVAPDYRRHGLASRIIRTVAETAVERGIDDLWLYTLRNSRASKFYGKLGFQVPPKDDYRHVKDSRLQPMSISPTRVIGYAHKYSSLVLEGKLPPEV